MLRGLLFRSPLVLFIDYLNLISIRVILSIAKDLCTSTCMFSDSSFHSE